MKCLIIDADKKSRLSLEKLLKETNLFKTIHSCDSPEKALALAMEDEINVVFFDMLKPGMDGIGFLSDLPYQRPHIVIVTSKKEAAVDAFNYEAIDFLLKPIDHPRLMKAVARVIKRDEKKEVSDRKLDNLFVKLDGHLLKISAKDICVIESLADYIKIYTTDKEYTVYSTFKRIMSHLSSKDFMRIHRSYIVRLDKIKSIQDGTVLVDKHSIPVSSSFRQDLMDRLRIL